MDLIIRTVAPFSHLDTPATGWKGPSTGMYWHPPEGAWYEVGRPWLLHRCRVHSMGVHGTGHTRHAFLRCRCGGYIQARLLRGWEPGQSFTFKQGAAWCRRNSRFWNWHPGFLTTL
jgi:hypothetical protein